MTASAVSSATEGSVNPTRPRDRRRRERRSAVVPAHASDHASIYHFLTAVFQGPSRSEFRASLEEPHYKPDDRLLVKYGPKIVAHAHVTHRAMHFGPLRPPLTPCVAEMERQEPPPARDVTDFGSVHPGLAQEVWDTETLKLPVTWLDWLGTLPRHRRQGHAHRVLAAAEARMAASGAILGLMWTRIPCFFRGTGWALCGKHGYCRASARGVLARLMARGLLPPGRKRLSIRPWRRLELGALVRIYEEGFQGMFGPVERAEAYWKWLIRRRAYDQICVALDGPDLLELEEAQASIVGYAVTSGERILELVTDPRHPTAAAQLLARACRDAIERGRHTIRLDAPPDSRVDKLFRSAGGVHFAERDLAAVPPSRQPASMRRLDRPDPEPRRECDPGTVLMAKLLDPVRLLRALGGQLHHRALTAGLAPPADLGLLVDGFSSAPPGSASFVSDPPGGRCVQKVHTKRYRVAITRGGAYLTVGNVGRSYLRLNVADFTRLLLGCLDWHRTVSEGRLRASTAIAMNAGRALFPRLPLWCPPLDSLPAKG